MQPLRKQMETERSGWSFVFLKISLYDSRSSSCTCKSWSVRRTRRWSRQPGKFPHCSHWPTTQQWAVMCATSATRPGLKIRWTSFKWLHFLKRTWFICRGHIQVWEHLSDKWCWSAFPAFEHKFEKHSTAILPRSDWNIPSLHITRSTFLNLMEQFGYVSHSLVCPSWLCCKICLVCAARGTWFNFVLSLYSLIKG